MNSIRKLPFFELLCWHVSLCLLLSQFCACGSATKPLYPTNVTKSTSIEDYYGVAVAVLDFTNNTDIGQAGDIMQSAFAMALMRSGKFELVDRSHMDVLLGERDLSAEGVVDKDPQELGRLLGARVVVVGTVTDAKPYKYVPPRDFPDVKQEQSTTVIVDQPDDQPDKKKAADDEDDGGGGAWAWIVAGVVAVAAIVTFYWLWGSKDDPDAARIGAYVKLIDVDTGKILWQGEETYSGGDPRVQALAPEDKHEELEKELTAVAGLLSEELVKTM